MLNKPSRKIICSLRLQHRKDPTPRAVEVECNNLELVPNSSLLLVMAVLEASAQASVAMLEVQHLEPDKANSSHNNRLFHLHHRVDNSNSLHHKADYLVPQSRVMLLGPDCLAKPKSHPIKL